MEPSFVSEPVLQDPTCQLVKSPTVQVPTAKEPAKPSPQNGPAAFLRFAEPHLREAFAEIHRADLFEQHLRGELLLLIEPTLVLELHQARLDDKLAGATPEERFQDFIDQLGQPETRLRISRTYPVLVSQIQIVLGQAVAAGNELLERLAADWPAICAELAGGHDPGPLVRLEIGRGDRHRSGRSVSVLHFESGWKLVYKPRPLEVDLHFRELLGWIRDRGFELELKLPRFLARAGYGWVEYLEALPCCSEAEVERFYERTGALLAVLHALLAVDVHYENVLAVGEHPILVDLETLLHPQPQLEIESARELQQWASIRSVLHVGLLPKRYWAKNKFRGVELSGIGGAKDQPDALPTRVWQGAGTDTMRAGYAQGRLRGAKNRPSLDGEAVDPCRYKGALARGFEEIYRLLAAHRAELLAPSGPLATFADDVTRFLLRPTRAYNILIEKSLHPLHLRDSRERSRFLERLWDPKLSANLLERDPEGRMIAAEIADLEEGCIPLFEGRPGSRDLWTSRGQRIPEFFDLPPLEKARGRILAFGDDDLARQLWMLRASFVEITHSPKSTAARSTEPQATGGVLTPLLRRRSAPSRERALELARRAGRRLTILATRGAGRAVWMGPASDAGQRRALLQLGLDFHNGLPGIALFLAHLGEATGERRFTDLAREAVRSLEDIIEQQQAVADEHPEVIDWVGAFRGWGGNAYAYAHLATLWDDAALAERAVTLAAHAETLIELDDRFDVVFGAAGCAGAMTSLLATTPSKVAAQLARRCGEHLLGIDRPSEGFAEGEAGIAWGLLRAFKATGEARFRDAALRAWGRERRRGREDSAGDDLSWYRGAVGTGLARLEALASSDGFEAELLSAEIDNAVTAVLAGRFGADHSLAQGDLGRLELVRRAAEAFDRPAWAAAADQIADRILSDLEVGPWRCADLPDLDTPGLMTGLAGIGLGLLRIASPTTVPSVLLLEPPPRTTEEA